MVAMDGRQAIHERGAYRPLAIFGRHLLAPVDGGEDGRAGEHFGQDFQHIFRAAELVEPVVDEGESHLVSKQKGLMVQPLRTFGKWKGKAQIQLDTPLTT